MNATNATTDDLFGMMQREATGRVLLLSLAFVVFFFFTVYFVFVCYCKRHGGRAGDEYPQYDYVLRIFNSQRNTRPMNPLDRVTRSGQTSGDGDLLQELPDLSGTVK